MAMVNLEFAFVIKSLFDKNEPSFCGHVIILSNK